jgi:transposase-like protein
MTRRRTEDWQALCEAQAQSGLSGAAFCREHGLNPSQFWRWRRKLEGRRASGREVAGRSAFVPVAVRGAERAVAIDMRVGPTLALRLPSSVAPGWLAALLRALRD